MTLSFLDTSWQSLETSVALKELTNIKASSKGRHICSTACIYQMKAFQFKMKSLQVKFSFTEGILATVTSHYFKMV